MAVGDRWYASRQEIDESSPSRRDGIDHRMEKYLRISYSNFLQDMGMRLQVPQVTIATAILFCHRFFLRQSHLRNDSKTVATSCMVLAVKVEETPRKLRDIILVSFEIIHELDRETAFCRIKQKEVYNQQKMLILLGERVVLATLGFDLNVHHPYSPLVEAIQKFEVAEKNGLLQVAWNYVNDGLRTSLCLQFKPHQIAAAAISLAAKRLKVKLPFDGERFWQQEFEVTPCQLEEMKNQLMAVYEQNWVFVPQLKGSEMEGSPEEGDYGGGGEAAAGNDFVDGKDDWNDNSMEQMRCNMIAFLGRYGGADDVKGEDHDRSNREEAGDRIVSGSRRRIGSELLLAM